MQNYDFQNYPPPLWAPVNAGQELTDRFAELVIDTAPVDPVERRHEARIDQVNELEAANPKLWKFLIEGLDLEGVCSKGRSMDRFLLEMVDCVRLLLAEQELVLRNNQLRCQIRNSGGYSVPIPGCRTPKSRKDRNRRRLDSASRQAAQKAKDKADFTSHLRQSWDVAMVRCWSLWRQATNTGLYLSSQKREGVAKGAALRFALEPRESRAKTWEVCAPFIDQLEGLGATACMLMQLCSMQVTGPWGKFWRDGVLTQTSFAAFPEEAFATVQFELPDTFPFAGSSGAASDDRKSYLRELANLSWISAEISERDGGGLLSIMHQASAGCLMSYECQEEIFEHAERVLANDKPLSAVVRAFMVG